MKRSGPPKRRKRLDREKPMRSRKGSTKYSRRERSTDYMLAVKKLPCAALIVPGHVCEGPIEADHAGLGRGIGQKAHDSTVIPMCQLGHRQRTDFSGPFRSWDQAQMREFLTGRIVQTQRTMIARGFVVPPLDITTAPPRAELTIEVTDAHGRSSTTVIKPLDRSLAEDLREVGNVDVRHPDAAPLPVARLVTEGDQHR